MKILVTGAAGFIGSFVAKQLVANGHTVIGLDNINDYYSVDIKYDRLGFLGISREDAIQLNKLSYSSTHKSFGFIRLDLTDKENIVALFKKQQFDVVCNLAAQAGVRYSIENPEAYIESNIIGFTTILECCRNFKIKHLVYASSSSVYGLNKKVPFSTADSVDHPISLYAATKKSNELMAHTYSHLYGFATTGLRFFTVYGPWGRPDMAMFLFTDAIVNNKPIKIFNNGKLERDFTYIDDIVEGVVKILEKDVSSLLKKESLYRVYNIGNSSSVKLMDFIDAIEKKLNTTAKKEYLPMQAGDVEKTWADVTDLKKDFNYQPNTPIKDGVANFIDWYLTYFKVNPKNL